MFACISAVHLPYPSTLSLSCSLPLSSFACVKRKWANSISCSKKWAMMRTDDCICEIRKIMYCPFMLTLLNIPYCAFLHKSTHYTKFREFANVLWFNNPENNCCCRFTVVFNTIEKRGWICTALHTDGCYKVAFRPNRVLQQNLPELCSS